MQWGTLGGGKKAAEKTLDTGIRGGLRGIHFALLFYSKHRFENLLTGTVKVDFFLVCRRGALPGRYELVQEV